MTDKTQRYYAADLTIPLDIDPRMIWKETRRHHVHPTLDGNKYFITVEQVEVLEKSMGVKIARKTPKKKKTTNPSQVTDKSLRPRRNAKIEPTGGSVKPTPGPMMLEARQTVNDVTLKRNRQRIAEMERGVKSGKVRPRVEGVADVKVWWKWEPKF